ncbi:hypothetical protein [Sinanaerobacter sp. ZZT-01]|uniref:hypothetical protein n=1 Tax=Sinanaerobacter sp. ZZT-01 TaxID=3111540 RepID=UPI002D77D40F|nr:hypothetical protein [Sinanaerobacter sp. ZZT-01]WRR94184.1 hypothetical protein U5921_03435 [Sinanaerobacter sp. ZZT-01]
MASILMAVGNKEIEKMISDFTEIHHLESVEDLNLIQDVISYENYDFVLINTLLSEKKAIQAAAFIHEKDFDRDRPKIIALIKDFEQRKLIAQLVGLEVNAFVTFNQLESIQSYIKEYPETFDWNILSNNYFTPQETTNSNNTRLIGAVTIGIFNLAHGAGATTSAVTIAEELQSQGFEVVVISMDDKTDLHYLDKKKKKATYIIPQLADKKIEVLAAYKSGCQFILLDFGNLFELSPTGQRKTERLADKEYEIEEFFRCNYKIAVGFSDEWNVGKLNYFINNPVFDDLETFIFLIRGLTDRIAKQYNLNFCSSTDTALEILLMWLGIEQNREKVKGEKKSVFSFLFNY